MASHVETSLFFFFQVGAKRTNRPGISTTDRGFSRARFRSRGGNFSSRARYYSGYTPPRGRGRAFRSVDTLGEDTAPACCTLRMVGKTAISSPSGHYLHLLTYQMEFTCQHASRFFCLLILTYGKGIEYKDWLKSIQQEDSCSLEGTWRNRWSLF